MPLAAITYYFTDLAELLQVAATELVGRWAEQAREGAARGADSDTDVVTVLADIVLPPGDAPQIRTRYEHLAAAGRVAAVAQALAGLRPELLRLIDIELARSRVLGIGASTVLSVVDGAALGALSEGVTDPRAAVIAELRALLGR